MRPIKEFEEDLKKKVEKKSTMDKCMTLLTGNQDDVNDTLTLVEIKEFEGI